MPLPMTYRRRKILREKGGTPDVYQYNEMSEKLRTQVIVLMAELADLSYINATASSIYKVSASTMRMEMGQMRIADRNGYSLDSDASEFICWLSEELDIDYLLSGIEVFLNTLSNLNLRYEPDIDPRKALIDDLNAYMLEDEFGFQFESGQIIEIGSTHIHKEVVVPVLGLLSDSRYATVNEEFRKAHTEFRGGDFEDCIHDCCNSFESMMKIIAKEQDWTEVHANSKIKDLVKAIFDHEYIPSYMQEEFTGLRTILEGGINTVRNKAGGHGQGAIPRKIDKQVAEFQLNQTAAVLKLLAEYNK